MKLIGLSGGIGSGKSSVSARLAAKGAIIVDADLIARGVVVAPSAVLDRLGERFGPEILRSDGALDRAALAAIVFGDGDALADLNAITHPAINEEIDRQIACHVGSDRVVVLDSALLFETRRPGLLARVVVDVDAEIAVERLVAGRGFTAADARARIAAQMPRSERLALADYVVDNSGSEADLDARVDALWDWISGLVDVPGVAPRVGPV